MTNRRHRFVFAEKMTRKFQRVFVGAERIRIQQSARDHQRIEFFRSRLVDGKIDIELVALVRVIHSLNLPRFQRDDFRFRAGFIERFARFSHLHLFETIGHKDGHLFAF